MGKDAMADSSHPLVTFAVIAYNQQATIAEAVESALTQDYPALEILLSDDASTDGTFACIEALAQAYRGSHALRIHRNRHNLGLIAHVNQVFEMARGELIVIAAGDDVSLPRRTSELAARYFSREPRPGLLHSSAIRIDMRGRELGLWRPPRLGKPMDAAALARCWVVYIGATGAWNPQIYRRFGPMRAKASYEDLVLGFRAALEGGIDCVDQALVRYRVDTGMTRHRRSGTLFGDFVRAERRHVELCLATLEQRLADLEHAQGVDACGLAAAMRDERDRQLLRRCLLSSPWSAWRESTRFQRLRLVELVGHEIRQSLKFAFPR